MQILKFLPVAIIAGCTSVPSTGGPAAGSQEWFETASTQDIAEYFRGRCVSLGYMPGTRQMAQCIETEARAQKQMAVARRAAAASGTAGY